MTVAAEARAGLGGERAWKFKKALLPLLPKTRLPTQACPHLACSCERVNSSSLRHLCRFQDFTRAEPKAGSAKSSSSGLQHTAPILERGPAAYRTK